MEIEIIDSHTHWGPSITMGTEVTTKELLEETNRIRKFIPYYYIPETMKPIPDGKGFYGGKWHWMRGVQDCSSNYQALKDPRLEEFIDASEKIDLPTVIEEEFAFTEAFVKKTKSLKIIIPHLGGLGGNPMDFLQAFERRENVYFDTALASADTVMKFTDKIGHERILFGSDVPFGTMKWELEKVLSLPIGDDKKEWIFSRNLKGLIGLAGTCPDTPKRDRRGEGAEYG